MTTKTYTLIGIGSYGPAHPLHDPRCRIYAGGKYAHTAANATEGHLWAIRQGLAPERKELLDSPKYQELTARVRYERSGLW